MQFGICGYRMLCKIIMCKSIEGYRMQDAGYSSVYVATVCFAKSLLALEEESSGGKVKQGCFIDIASTPIIPKHQVQ